MVLVPFPFSDLSQAKLRPAVALADVGRGDWILCQVTSNPYGDPRAVHLTASSFSSGSLRSDSYARPGKLFTASRDLMVAEVAILNADAQQQVVDAVVAILRASDGR
ncbi:MAG: type II toxin-antitoxin system PemK/MazF family toxin [Candidatus Rokubacteria bacterium]|nr:type II toxin-antitoxin system PemK/MazF family toxin [Candidatus Rokubacteria bacterium]